MNWRLTCRSTPGPDAVEDERAVVAQSEPVPIADEVYGLHD